MALFEKNLQRVKELVRVAKQMEIENNQASQDILRSAMVLLVSALDTFVHDVVRIGMMQILKGERKQTPEYQKFRIEMHVVSFNASYDWFDAEIRRRHSESSFQSAGNITKGLKLIYEKDIWSSIAQDLNGKEEETKKKLDAIVRKRNQIAHESDVDPTSFDESYYPISVEDVEEHIKFIGKLVYSINRILLS